MLNLEARTKKEARTGRSLRAIFASLITCLVIAAPKTSRAIPNWDIDYVNISLLPGDHLIAEYDIKYFDDDPNTPLDMTGIDFGMGSVNSGLDKEYGGRDPTIDWAVTPNVNNTLFNSSTGNTLSSSGIDTGKFYFERTGPGWTIGFIPITAYTSQGALDTYYTKGIIGEKTPEVPDAGSSLPLEAAGVGLIAGISRYLRRKEK